MWLVRQNGVIDAFRGKPVKQSGRWRFDGFYGFTLPPWVDPASFAITGTGEEPEEVRVQVDPEGPLRFDFDHGLMTLLVGDPVRVWRIPEWMFDALSPIHGAVPYHRGSIVAKFVPVAPFTPF